MANAAIWFYPSEAGGAVEIDLGGPLSGWAEDPDERSGQGATNGDQTPVRVDFGGRASVLVTLQAFDDHELAAKLASLESHLKAGLPVSVAADSTKAYAGFTSSFTLEAGKSKLKLGGNVFFICAGIATPPVSAAADHYVIRSQNPGGRVERIPGTAWSSSTHKMTLGRSTWYDHAKGPVFVRHSQFLPIAYLAPEGFDTTLLTTDRGVTYTMSIPLVEAPGDYAALYSETDGEGAASSFDYNDGAVPLGPIGSGAFEGNGDDDDAVLALADAGFVTLQALLRARRFTGDIDAPSHTLFESDYIRSW
jgi:hypothetical protein